MKLKQLLKQALEGDTFSAFYLGYLYETGNHTEAKKNNEEAIYWYTVSANRGGAAAHFNLARLLLMEKEDVRALVHFESAAELGHVKGAFNAARIHENGKAGGFEVETNLNKALYYYRLSVSLGDAQSVDKVQELSKKLEYNLHELPSIQVIPNLTASGERQVITLTDALNQTQQEGEVLNLLLQEARAKKNPWEINLQNRLNLHQAQTSLLGQQAEHLLKRETHLMQREQHFTNDHHQLSLQEVSLKRLEQELNEREKAWQVKVDSLAKEVEQQPRESLNEEKMAMAKEIIEEKQRLAQERLEFTKKQNQLKQIEQELKQQREVLEQDKNIFAKTREQQEQEFQQKLAEQVKQQKDELNQEQEKLTALRQKLDAQVKEFENRQMKSQHFQQQLSNEKQQLTNEHAKLIAERNRLQNDKATTETEWQQLKQKEQVLENREQVLRDKEDELKEQTTALEKVQEKLRREIQSIEAREQLLIKLNAEQQHLEERKGVIERDLREAQIEKERAESLKRKALEAEQKAKAAEQRVHEAEEVLRLQLRLNPENHFLRAIQKNNLEVLQICVQIGLDPNRRDVEGNTPLHYIIQYINEHSIEMVEILLAAGANPTITNKLQQTPLKLLQMQSNKYKNKKYYDPLVKTLQKAQENMQQVKGIGLFALLNQPLSDSQKSNIENKLKELITLRQQINSFCGRAMKTNPDRETELQQLYTTYGKNCFAVIFQGSTVQLPTAEIVRATLYQLQGYEKATNTKKLQIEAQLAQCKMRIATLLTGMNLSNEEVKEYYQAYHSKGFIGLPGLTQEQIWQQVKPRVDQEFQQWKSQFAPQQFTATLLTQLGYKEKEAKRLIKFSKNSKDVLKNEINKLEPQRFVIQQSMQAVVDFGAFCDCLYKIIENEVQLRQLNSEQLSQTCAYYFNYQERQQQLNGSKPRRRILCKGYEFELWNTIDRQEAKLIYQQTNYVVPFERDQQKVENFKVGEGATGKISIALDVKQNKIVAVKETTGWETLQEVNQERILHEQLSGLPHIMPLYASVVSEDVNRNPAFYQFMLLADLTGKELKERLQTLSDKLLLLKIVRHLAQALLEGILAMHQQKQTCHFDIKPDNFVMSKGKIYLIDFGYSRQFALDNNAFLQRETGAIGDSRYSAPERLAHERYLWQQCDGRMFAVNDFVSEYDARLSDAWSIGILLLELLLKKHPLPIEQFPNSDVRQSLWDRRFYSQILSPHFQSEEFLEFKKLDAAFCDMLQGLLQIDLRVRMHVEDALKYCQSSGFKDDKESQQAFDQLKQLNAPVQQRVQTVSNQTFFHSQPIATDSNNQSLRDFTP